MKFTSVLVTVVVGVLLQVALARFTVGGTWVFDLVLVAVVFAGLQWGPTAGMIGGTLGGLLQDLLSGTIAGVSGLAKTLVGFVAGLIGTQFVLTRAHGRSIIVAGCSIVHRVLMLALTGLIEQHWPGTTWGAMLAETIVNTAAGFVLFQLVATVPGLVARQRLGRRAGFGRRQW
ncbi:MAG: rod shape-determining protein MreD [Acidobacteriota bacterium]|jgi:rod shape-determining protein MreD|nr:MAG: rod shape-determining protein MreD [Acidobacteriota bacterium]